MPIEGEILSYLVSIEKSLNDLHRQMDECLVMANRIDWNMKYHVDECKTRA
jgi:hypothetical protein